MAAVEMQDPTAPGSLRSETDRLDGEKSLEFRRALKLIEDERTTLRNQITTLAGFEGPLLKNDQMREFTMGVCRAQAEILEKCADSLGKVETKLREVFPPSVSPAIILADKEEWHIKVGFSYPDADGTGTTTRYGPGEPIPPHMTQEDCDIFYAKGHIYKYERGKDGMGVYKPHPKVIQMSRAQIFQLLRQGPVVLDKFTQQNVIKLDTLLRMKVCVAEFNKEEHTLDPRVEQIIDRQIGIYEKEATGSVS